MKTITITFKSHYNKLSKEIRLKAEKAVKLLNEESPIEAYREDCDRLLNDCEPRYFSKYQLNELGSIPGIDFWDSISKK